MTRNKSHRETACLVMSDLNLAQLRSRRPLLIERLSNLRREVLGGYDIEELILAIVGTVSHSHEGARDLGEELFAFATGLLPLWGVVRIEGVAANVGVGEDCFDVEMLATCAERARSPLSVNFNPKSPFLRRVEVAPGQAAILYHGQGLKSILGVRNRVDDWSDSLLSPFSIVALGSSPQCQFFDHERVAVFRGGSDKWWLFGSSQARAVTWMYRLDLE